MRQFSLVIGLLMIVLACQPKQYGAFVIAGKIENSPVQQLSLMEIPFTGEQPVIVDSATLKKNGNFELRSVAGEEGLYKLVLSSGHEILLVNDGHNIRVRADINNFRRYTVEGSTASAQLHELLETLYKKDSSFQQQLKQTDSLTMGNMTDSVRTIVEAQRDRVLRDRRQILEKFIKKTGSPAAICYALGQFDELMDITSLKKLTDEAASRFPEHSGLARFKSLVTLQVQPEKPGYALLNQMAPEIKLPTPAGDSFALSSLRGKYVLVDFWASWCGPCRRENPNVVSAYNQFKDKNFTILGVSLDREKAGWVEAIQADGLGWTQISDLKYWNSVVVGTYRFEGIPFNVLIDPSGKIIASDLRGPALSRKLSEVLR